MAAQSSPELRLSESTAAAEPRYVVYGEIASGGMASVRYGRLMGARGFSRAVAIKCLHPQFAKEPEFVAMFVDEARLSARLLHANIIHTLDVIELHSEVALVMEYVHGESLWTLLRIARAQGIAIPIPVACALVASVLHGLHAAHEARGDDGAPIEIVHRDVSPQNVLVGSDGIPRVLDFGIAKALGRLRSTPHGEIKGKLGYIACEQLRGSPVDRRTDVYGASAVLWETLVGAPLFDGASDSEVVHRVLYDTVVPPSSQRRDVPSGLDAIVLRGLRRDATQRFPTAKEMALAIERECSLATQSEIAAWLHGLAGPRLASRAQALAAMQERGAEITQSHVRELPSGTRRVQQPKAARAVGVHEQVTVFAPIAEVAPRRRARGWRVVWVLSAIAAAAALALLWPTLQRADRAGASQVSVVQPARVAGPELGVQLKAAEPVEPSASVAAFEERSAGPAPAPAAILPASANDSQPAAAAQPDLKNASATPSAAIGRALKRRSEGSKPARVQQAAAKKSCELYYYVDERGIRRPKPECL